MPQPRKYATNAERQAAYRRRKKRQERMVDNVRPPSHTELVRRIEAQDKAARDSD